MSDSERNPLLIPGRAPPRSRRGCPKCGHDNFSGRNVAGIVTFTCAKCRNKWHGGLGQVMEDPTIPKPPINPKDKPLVDFAEHPKTGKIEEIRRSPSLVQEFRKGLPIRNGEE